VVNPGKTPRRVLDPYAKSMAEVRVKKNGTYSESVDTVGKSAIVRSSMVPGMLNNASYIKGYEGPDDAVIWEIHVRDFTSDPSIEGDLGSRWGTFKAFIDKLPYIKDLGVSHIQLLPVNGWYYGDELAMKERDLAYSAASETYNWGYDPHCYFSPDGAYSENPRDPELRISELKELISAIHAAGMGVILDVVYTHMADAKFLEDIVPDYYFFRDKSGNFVGGFGNNLATNRLMVQKLIIDSVKYWFTEYGIDGMRWDMMGDATYDVVQKAFDEAQQINSKALFIGEGWRTFSGHIDSPELAGKAADQDWMATTDSVGVFSDEFRNELKSGFGCEGEPRFITGGKRNIDLIFRNIKAQPENTPSTKPSDMVQYIAAHDNMPLYDVIAQSIKKDPSIEENNDEILKRVRLGNAMVLLSQGIAFLHGGQEYGRTKQWLKKDVPEQKFHKLKDLSGKPFKYPYFIHDSYNSSDAVNMFDHVKASNYSRYPLNVMTRNYTRGLIALRRSTDAFSLPTKALVDENVRFLNFPEIKEEDLFIAYSSKSTLNSIFYVFINGDSITRKMTLSEDLTMGLIVVDNVNAGINPLTNPSGVTLTSSSIEVSPLSVIVIEVRR
jgi:secreted pullulanase